MGACGAAIVVVTTALWVGGQDAAVDPGGDVTATAEHAPAPGPHPSADAGEVPPGEIPRLEVDPQAAPVLGPTGLGDVLLGQTVDQAMATGLLGDRDPVGGDCAVYLLAEAIGTVHLSGTVQAIAVPSASTPEGAGPGWTVEQVKATYPDLDEDRAMATGRAVVAVPGHPEAAYRFGLVGGVVADVTLQAAGQTCYP